MVSPEKYFCHCDTCGWVYGLGGVQGSNKESLEVLGCQGNKNWGGPLCVASEDLARMEREEEGERRRDVDWEVRVRSPACGEEETHIWGSREVGCTS